MRYQKYKAVWIYKICSNSPTWVLQQNPWGFHGHDWNSSDVSFVVRSSDSSDVVLWSLPSWLHIWSNVIFHIYKYKSEDKLVTQKPT